MTDSELLKMYVPMVSFLADVCGGNCEVVLHDVTNPERSVIAIENSMTDRTVGSPMTDLALEIQKNGEYKNADYLSNYNGRAKGRDFLSSTYYIKNGGRLVGMLCINRNLTPVGELKKMFDAMLEHYNLTKAPQTEIQENLDNPIESMLKSMIADAIAQTGISPERMSMSEKVALVQRLNEQGVLRMKGAVYEIAAQMKISEPTVYRYLSTINR